MKIYVCVRNVISTSKSFNGLPSIGDDLLKRHTIRNKSLLRASLQIGFPPKNTKSDIRRLSSVKSDGLTVDGWRSVMLLFVSEINLTNELVVEMYGKVKVPEILLESK